MHAFAASLLSLFLFLPLGPGWLGVFLDAEAERAVVTEVIDGSPAAKAGFVAGDVMLAVDGKETATREQFVAAIRAQQAGAKIGIKLRRAGKDKVIEVHLGERPDDDRAVEEIVEVAPAAPPTPVVAAPVRVARAVPAPVGRGYLGISINESSDGLAIDRVVQDSPAAKAGVQTGEVLHTIGDHRVRSLGDLDRALAGKGPGTRVALGLSGEGGKRSVMVELGQRPGTARAPIAEDAVTAPPIATATEPQPARPARAARPARPARPAAPARAAEAATPAEPAPPPSARAVRAPRAAASAEAADDELREELRELRKELAELRRMLERLKREGRE